MIAKTYLAKLNVKIGEYENDVSLLVVANSDKQAESVLDAAAAEYYGDADTPREDGGYYANGGEVHVSAKSIFEIGLATFTELKSCLRVKRAENVQVPDLDAVGTDLKNAASVVTNALKKRHVDTQKAEVLDALSAALGLVSWQVLSAKFKDSSNAAGTGGRLLVLPSGDGPAWNLYATLPVNVDADKVTALMQAWLDKQRDEDAKKPEGEDFTETDVLSYLVTLGAMPFQDVVKGPYWD